MRRRLTILGLCLACLLVVLSTLAPPGLAYDPKVICSLPVDPSHFAVAGDYLYAAGGGLQVVDVGNPVAPVVVGSCSLADSAADVAVAGGYAFVSEWGMGIPPGRLQVVDVHNPAAPVVVGECALPKWAGHVAVAGDHAYVADGSADLQVVDVSDPTTPVVVGGCAVEYDAAGVAVVGDLAYVATRGDVSTWAGLEVVDVRDPAAPVVIGSCSLPAGSRSVTVAGDYAYVAAGGLQVVDVSDPAAPAVTGSYSMLGMWGSPTDVAVVGDLAYLTVDAGGLHVVDVSDPAAPVVAGVCVLPIPTSCVAVAGEYAYASSGGLQVLDLTPPQLTGLTPDYAMPGTTIVIAGSELGSSGTVAFGSTVATTSAWNDTSITCTVPAGLAAGPTSVTVTPSDGAASNALAFTIDGLVLTASAKPAVVAYKGVITVKGQLHDTRGTLLPGFTLVLQTSTNGTRWTDLRSVNSSTGTYSATTSIVRKTYFRWSFAGDGTYVAGVSPTCSATCRAKLTAPSVPSTVRRGVKYVSSGYLRPQHTGGRAPITISFYRYVSGSWRLMMGGTWSDWDNVSGATRYRIWFRLGTNDAGRWRVRAMHRDADHAKTYSAWRYFTVS